MSDVWIQSEKLISRFLEASTISEISVMLKFLSRHSFLRERRAGRNFQILEIKTFNATAKHKQVIQVKIHNSQKSKILIN